MKNRYLFLILVVAIAGIVFHLAQAGSSTSAFAQGSQKVFADPDEAIRVLLEACRINDETKLIELFGAGNKDLVITSDRAMDAYGRKKLYRIASEKLVKQQKGKDEIILVMGKIEWPFPFPLVKEGTGWHFDSVKGRDEIINRRVGRNELNAIAVCSVFVEAQRQYASKDREGDGIIQYARRFNSTMGKKDGLYWTSDPSKNEDLSPLGPALVESQEYTSNRKEGEPFYGYYFRILTKQGESAPGGAYDYIINGHMVAGYAMIAYPSDYGTSGVTTFIVNQCGKVYQKDLGKDTIRAAQEITEYNPDKTWKVVQDKGILATD
ncbi:MAG: DUF2950 domain-containing protein [Vulcanimicrobiota bacterium]